MLRRYKTHATLIQSYYDTLILSDIVSCSAVNGDGLQEGLDWLTSVVTGKMIKKDITESLKTSVKDVTKATTQMQEKTHHYGFGKIKSSLQWILSGCKG